jgi:hypothetical protein
MSLKKKIQKQIRNMPKYKIQDEAFDNQAIARARAFGRDRSIQKQSDSLDQQAANSLSAAQDVTSSTSGLLSVIAAIDSNNTAARRGLAQDEASIQSQNTRDLYQVNSQMIDEKDKAWNQNVYAPWDAKLRNLQARKARRQAVTDNIIGGVLSAVGTAAGAAFGGPKGAEAGSKLGSGFTQGGEPDWGRGAGNPYYN